jgi:hypothetical protein
MSERNEQMAAMLAANAPARDLAFEIAVLAKIEQRRFVRGMARSLGAAALAALALALVMPQLDWVAILAGSLSHAFSPLAGNSVVMALLLIAAFAAWHVRPAAKS